MQPRQLIGFDLDFSSGAYPLNIYNFLKFNQNCVFDIKILFFFFGTVLLWQPGEVAPQLLHLKELLHPQGNLVIQNCVS